MKENARQRFWKGSLPPIGYRVAGRREAKVKKKLEIDPLHAYTIRLIRWLALEGDGANGPMGVKNDRRQERAERACGHIAEPNQRAAETDLRRSGSMTAIEAGIADLDDPALKERIASLKAIRDQAQADAAFAMLQTSGQVRSSVLKWRKGARSNTRKSTAMEEIPCMEFDMHAIGLSVVEHLPTLGPGLPRTRPSSRHVPGKETTSGPNAEEECDTLLFFTEARLAFELSAVSLRRGGGGLQIASVGHPDIGSIAVEDKRLRGTDRFPAGSQEDRQQLRRLLGRGPRQPDPTGFAFGPITHADRSARGSGECGRLSGLIRRI